MGPMRAISTHSRVSPEYELDEHGEKTGRTRQRQFAIAWDEVDQRRGVFETNGESRGPSMFPRLEKWK